MSVGDAETTGALHLPGLVDGIDVSQVQAIPDPDAVYRAGFRFAFVKLSEAAGYCDPRAQGHLAALRDAGLHVGGYGFARVAGEPRAQARATVDRCAGNVHIVRPVLDLETAPEAWGASQLCDFAAAWLDEARKSGGLPVLYSYTSFLARMRAVGYTGLSALLDATPLWLAHYRSTSYAWAPASEADMPRGYDWQLWQSSGDRGSPVPGIAGDCDRNLFRGSPEELREFFGLPPEGTTVDMGGPVHGSHVVDGALAERGE